MIKDGKDQPATKRDVEEIVGRVVGEIVGDALQLIAGRFDQVDRQFKEVNRRLDLHDVEFNSIHKRLDGHDAQFAQMKQRFDQQDEGIVKLHGISTRTECKLDATIEDVDGHGLTLRRLKRRSA